MMTIWNFKGCQKCCGDLFMDDGDWQCLQCGRYYYRRPVVTVPEPAEQEHLSFNGHQPRRRRPSGGIAGRNINAFVNGQRAHSERWWTRNQNVIHFLSQGRTVEETAKLAGRTRRQVKEVMSLVKEMDVQAQEAPPRGVLGERAVLG